MTRENPPTINQLKLNPALARRKMAGLPMAMTLGALE